MDREYQKFNRRRCEQERKRDRLAVNLLNTYGAPMTESNMEVFRIEADYRLGIRQDGERGC